jgi:hypothetical protein
MRPDQQARGRKRTVYDQIISGFCTTLNNLSPISYNTKTVQVLPLLAPPWRHLVGYEQLTEGPMTTEILKPGVSVSKRPPTDPQLYLRYTQTQPTPAQALAQGSVTRWRSAPIGPHNGSCQQPLHQCDPRSDPLNFEGPHAHPATPKVTQQPPLDRWSDEPDRSPTQG